MISAKKLLLAGKAVRPFSMAGSFENGNDGWALSGAMARIQAAPRTGSWIIAGGTGGGEAFADYFLSRSQVSGLTVRASIYQRRNSSVSNRKIQYRIGNGTFVDLASVTNNTSAYVQLSGQFKVPAGQSAIVRIYNDNDGGVFDDWSIEGVRA